MLKQHPLLPLFKKFISQSKTGKRLNKNGTRIKLQTIANYTYCQKLLQDFEMEKDTPLTVYEVKGNNKREHTQLKKYWGNFYKDFTEFMYKKKECHDNYTGQNIKMIRTFFNWLNTSCGINTGPYHKSFYVCKEDIPIVTLNVQQLQYLVFDKAFEGSLSRPLRQAKDVFVIGCMVGLRYSDICKIRWQNIEQRDEQYYLKMRSQKTATDTMVKLPAPAVDIFNRYKKNRTFILPTVSLFCFNRNIKKLALLAGWTQPITKTRTKKGLEQKQNSTTAPTRFCDALSSHTMRRTSITTMLTSGMPEYVVRKISGHTSDSKAFFRYVSLAQSLMDTEIEKMHFHFQQPAVLNGA